MRELVALEEPDTMLRRDGTAALCRLIVHDAVEAMPFGEEGLGVHAHGLAEVEVDVAVADMPEGAHAKARHFGLAGRTRLDQEIRDTADRHGDIVLDRGTFMLLVFGKRLSQMPEGGRLLVAGGDGGILDFAHFQSGFHDFQQQRLQLRVRLGAREFHEGVGCVLPRERIARTRRMAGDNLKAKTGDDLEGGEPIARALPQAGEERNDLRRSSRAHKGRGARLRQREELQHGFRDDAECALRADEEVLQVIARIVLAQGRKPVPDRAIGQHHFQAEHEIARVAIAQNRRATGIRRDVPADGAGALGSQRQRIEKARFARGGLNLGQNRARFHGDRGIDRIDRFDGLQALQRDHHAAIGHAPADKAGIAALRHEGNPRRLAGLHHGRNLCRVRGGNSGDRRALREPPRLFEIGREIRHRRMHMLFADDRAEFGEKVGRHGGHPVLIWARQAATS